MSHPTNTIIEENISEHIEENPSVLISWIEANPGKAGGIIHHAIDKLPEVKSQVVKLLTESQAR